MTAQESGEQPSVQQLGPAIEQPPVEQLGQEVEAARAELGAALGEAGQLVRYHTAVHAGQMRDGGRALAARARTAAAAYVAEGEGWLDQGLRCLLLAVPPGLALGVAAACRAEPGLLVGVVPAVVWTVWRAGTPATPEEAEQQVEETLLEMEPQTAPDTPAEEPDDAPEETPAGPLPGPSPGEFIEVVRNLLGDRGKGIHLVEIGDRLRTLYPGRPWGPDEVAAAAERAGLPRTPTRSATRPGSTTGIRRESLPPAPPAPIAPHEGVVDAGESANNINNNAPDVRVEHLAEGTTIVRLPADAARHHTVRSPR